MSQKRKTKKATPQVVVQAVAPLAERYFTIPEACEVSRLSRTKLYLRISEGKLKIRKDGRRTILSAVSTLEDLR